MKRFLIGFLVAVSILTASFPAHSAAPFQTMRTCTDAEVAAGIRKDCAVTPAGLEGKTASTTDAGLVELATDAETIAGTATDKATTPANITAKLTDPGDIGSVTPDYGRFSPIAAKGPAIVNTGFAGTVTAAASTTVTFSSAADAVLAGYHATRPILGTTLISNSLTRYIVSWTNSTTAVVDSSVTWAGTAITSVQLPEFFSVTSSGVLTKAIYADGTVYIVGSGGIGKPVPSAKLDVIGTIGATVIDATVAFQMTNTGSSNKQWGIVTRGNDIAVREVGVADVMTFKAGGNILLGGLTAAGTAAAKVMAMGGSTIWTTSPADAAQVGVKDYNGTAGDARWHFGGEASATKFASLGSGTVSVKGALTTGGGLTRNTSEATVTLSGASGSIAVNVPSGARILGVQLRVDTAITSGDGATTWSADWINTATTAITSGKAFTKDTNYSALHAAYELTSGTATITITPNSGTFSGGVVRAVAYYEALDTLLAAP